MRCGTRVRHPGGPTAAVERPHLATGLDLVADVSAERLAPADVVAAAKYGTGKPIDDPVRERAVLEDVAKQSTEHGLDARGTKAVFRDQMEAGKRVQRGLPARWAAHPAERSTERVDLATQVRPTLDRLTSCLLNALAAAAPARDHPSCAAQLATHGTRAARERHFDSLHTGGTAARPHFRLLTAGSPSAC
ncbi:gamma subclass chorismate mutase AroQ [Streptomyces sp. B15]|uniref:gamma subclass chorismate mutase AroQ n=1 Tax=Streptomyces sp. B15 TaxID=1537797 RepID=UPI001B3931BB|nr:gamma subclass chorismate mutase AroQ [Streptomyces sp. B15]MBQ1118675.1 gamma subclass chorismate mutase AroQ [Streptomyces sp. B15]